MYCSERSLQWKQNQVNKVEKDVKEEHGGGKGNLTRVEFLLELCLYKYQRTGQKAASRGQDSQACSQPPY